MKRMFITVVAGLSLSLSQARADEKTRTVIGLSVPNAGHPVFQAGLRGAQEAADTLGVELVALDGQWNASKQAKDIDDLVGRHVDGIVVWRAPMASPDQNIEAAVTAGIPVAIANYAVNTDKGLVFVGEDEVESGQQAAKYVIEKLHGRGSIFLLEGPPGFAAVKMRVFEEALAKTKIKVLDRDNGGLDRGLSLTLVADFLKTHPKFDGIVAFNDEMMIGAIAAMRGAGVNPSKKVTLSFDAIPEAVNFVRAGNLSATVDPGFANQTGQALKILVDYIRDKTTPPDRVILLKSKLITKATLPNG